MSNAQQLYEEQKTNSCSMVGFLGIVIQLGLGILSFSVLILKRFRQHPKRPWKIWIFDTSKQLISQVLAHFINLTISIALTQNDKTSDECLWYLITNILDNSIGVLICVFCLIFIEKKLVQSGKRQYLSGNYYIIKKISTLNRAENYELEQQFNDNYFNEKPEISQESQKKNKDILVQEQSDQNVKQSQQSAQQKKKISSNDIFEGSATNRIVQDSFTEIYIINYKAWLVQLAIWISIVIVGKGILFGFEFGLEEPLKNMTFIVIGWIEKYPLLELFVAIVIIPVIMNGLAFWIQDNFLMKKEKLSQLQLQIESNLSQNIKDSFKQQKQNTQ